MFIAQLVVGAGLLVAGRRLFWFFVAGLGFIAGIAIVGRVFAAESEWTKLVIGLIAGLLGTVLAISLQKLAVGLAGFLAGGYVVVNLLQILGIDFGVPGWLPFVIGGIIGAVLIGILFEFALVALSSLTGSVLIVRTLDVSQIVGVGLLTGLFTFGFLIQVGVFGGNWKKTA